MTNTKKEHMTPILSLLRLTGITFIVLAVPLLATAMYTQMPGEPFTDTLRWLHSLLVMLTMIIAAYIFFIGWQVIDDRRPRASLLLACAFLSVAMFASAHLLSAPDMPAFVTENSSGKSQIFWYITRLIAAAALLINLLSASTSRQSPDRHPARHIYLTITLSVTAILWLAIVAAPTYSSIEALPHAVLMAGEWLILLILVVALLTIWRKHTQVDLGRPAALTMAVMLLATSQIFFLVSSNEHALGFLIGHVYVVLSFAYLYRAMFLDNIRDPFDRLQHALVELRNYSGQLDELLGNAPDGILGVDARGRIQFVNPGLEKMFGYASQELIGQPVEMLLPLAQRQRHTELRDSYLAKPTGRPMSSQRGLLGRRKDGSHLPVDIALGRHQVLDGMRITAFIRDVTERHLLEQQMQHRATHDMLTGLPNRALLQDRLERAIANARRHDSQFAVIMLDLDNFKDINDGWGHSIGDKLLISVSDRLQGTLREGDTVSRFGGDEFVILATDFKDARDIQTVVDKIVVTMSEKILIGDNQFHASGSIGVAVYPEHAGTAEELLSNADIAMYRAKALGRRAACFFDLSMNRDQQEAQLLKTRLINALERGELSVHYQPQYRISDQSIVGFEALARWYQADGSAIGPDEFIPVAEANGLIVPITEFVIQTVCDQIRCWSDAGFSPLVAVNISALHFRQEGLLLDCIAEQIKRAQIDPRLLALELTETALMDDSEITQRTLRRLVEMGIQVAIDDFGTGYSSLASLRLFPLSTLKIDRSFMRSLQSDPKAAAIVTGLISLSKSLGLQVLAEGVETYDQLQMLSANCCDCIQGWLMHPAMPAEDCLRLLQQQSEQRKKENVEGTEAVAGA